MQQIKHLDPSSAVMSQHDYGYDAAGEIATWTRNWSGLAAAQRYELDYDAAGQLGGAIVKNADTAYEIGVKRNRK